MLENKYQTKEVIALVEAIKTSKDMSLLPILADALEDAGYSDRQYLKHFRMKSFIHSVCNTHREVIPYCAYFDDLFKES